MGMAMAAVNPIPELNPIDDAWQSIANLRLRPGRTVHFYQHTYRGTPWLIISDQHNESYFRCSGDAEPFINLLDGSRSVEQALEVYRQSRPSELQQSDVIYLIGNLKSAGLLEDGGTLLGNDGGSQQNSKPSAAFNPFAIKFPLFDPDRMLEKTAHIARPLFSPVALYVWLGLVLLALATTVLNWNGLFEHGAARFADPKNLLWFWLLYPLVKGLHELGHAYATRRLGR